MKSEGKVRVIVRSKKVPARIVDVSTPAFTPSGVYLGAQKDRHVVYDTVLDDEHRRAIEEGRRLSFNLGLELEVVDAAKGVMGRVLSALGRGTPHGPVVVVSSPSSGYKPEASSELNSIR